MPTPNPKFTKKLKELQNSPLKPGEVIVICHHCGCPWKSTSTYEKVSCPSCGGKTDRVKMEAKKVQEKKK